MQFQKWLDENGLNTVAFGQRIHRPAETIRRYARGERIPQPDIEEEIERETGGAVTHKDHVEANREFRRRQAEQAAA